ncbi:MAG: hypothetical protein A3I86_01620 [Candidatus Zambryskibacteria bacterium RIFCSPLOWO2_02_FULL_39_14]|uniref:DUF5659 domain-containing protein n=1 Tax=Candidatus Zambryskibacteria bacterium RIFCSPLOWO2_02_FULL_39_14 TaxID=1802769 RepID=A0A1G2UJ12_9BACT|nr:MAG: hypothetical protein A3A56_01000 [Candidatus Roizmanbacteria bacterium RIFCSPLOWO2_01_FULL_40_32]OHB09391.1 MAG: hypothetical protein A3I86_01620 [Candidatus Zambryskibacteria bacterium RIFCSPLOWO2_02_FULL_39_14]
MNQNNKDFRTADLALTAALCVSGFVVEEVDKVSPQRSVFVFQNGEKLLEAINQYWRQEMRVEPQDYFNQLKIIKARIYER